MECPYCKTKLCAVDDPRGHIIGCHLAAMMQGKANERIEAALRAKGSNSQ